MGFINYDIYLNHNYICLSMDYNNHQQSTPQSTPQYSLEKTLVDAKDIYTDYLTNVLIPLIYEGLNALYDNAIAYEQKFVEASRDNPDITNPGVIVLFQQFLREIEKWSNNVIDDETQRIKDYSRCADIFDDLVRAVIKSHIIVLLYGVNSDVKQINALVKDYLVRFDVKFFIHKCYVECARIFYDHPYLFWRDFQSHELKENQTKIYQLIKIGIKNGIKRVLPMKVILDDYIHHDLREDNNMYQTYQQIKGMIMEDVRMEQARLMNNYMKANRQRDPMPELDEVFEGGSKMNIFNSSELTDDSAWNNLDGNMKLANMMYNDDEDKDNKNDNKNVNDSNNKDEDKEEVIDDKQDDAIDDKDVKGDEDVQEDKPVSEKQENIKFVNLVGKGRKDINFNIPINTLDKQDKGDNKKEDKDDNDKEDHDKEISVKQGAKVDS